MTSYKLSWNHKKYNWYARWHKSMADPQYRTFAQSLGRKTNPKKLHDKDIVYITCAGKCRMKGKLVSDPYQLDSIPQDDFVDPENDDRAQRHLGKWYCNIEITNWYLEELAKPMRGNQNTFCIPSDPNWNNI